LAPPLRRLAAKPTTATTATANAASPHGRTLLEDGDDGDADVAVGLAAGLVGVGDDDAPELVAAVVTVKPNVSETGWPSSDVTFQSTR
jgi:hypothetical protein